jgi:hypothetical protein
MTYGREHFACLVHDAADAGVSHSAERVRGHFPFQES